MQRLVLSIYNLLENATNFPSPSPFLSQDLSFTTHYLYFPTKVEQLTFHESYLPIPEQILSHTFFFSYLAYITSLVAYISSTHIHRSKPNHILNNLDTSQRHTLHPDHSKDGGHYKVYG